MNEPENTPIEVLNDYARDCSWFEVNASSSWFFHVVWEVAIVAVNRDQTTLSVLAASDTD